LRQQTEIRTVMGYLRYADVRGAPHVD
jgi:hypothetical protein